MELEALHALGRGGDLHLVVDENPRRVLDEDLLRLAVELGALGLVGLSDFANAYPRELSGGMKMRASVVRALVTQPRLLLLDEPFAALDEITRSRLNDDLLALWRERQFGALFITHSVFESIYLSTRVLVMAARPSGL